MKNSTKNDEKLKIKKKENDEKSVFMEVRQHFVVTMRCILISFDLFYFPWYSLPTLSSQQWQCANRLTFSSWWTCAFSIHVYNLLFHFSIIVPLWYTLSLFSIFSLFSIHLHWTRCEKYFIRKNDLLRCFFYSPKRESLRRLTRNFMTHDWIHWHWQKQKKIVKSGQYQMENCLFIDWWKIIDKVFSLTSWMYRITSARGKSSSFRSLTSRISSATSRLSLSAGEPYNLILLSRPSTTMMT